MNWLEIIRLLVVLWPIIEQIIAAIDGKENKAKATDSAIAAIVQVATLDKSMVDREDLALVAVIRAVIGKKLI